MAFDPTTATEVGGFDISSAKEDEGEASFKDLVKQKFAQAGDMADKGTTLALSNLAGLFQGPEAQDEMFRNLDERIKSRQEWVGKVPEKAALPARIGATVATLPVSIPAMFLDAGASAGKTAIDLGENVSDAQLASLIGMAGAELATVLPVAGKSFEWWRRGLQGALGNTAQTWITNALQRAAVKQKETKEAFTPKPEDYLDSAILGGAMGMSVRGAKKPSTSFDKKLEALLQAEALARAQQEVQTRELPPDAVVPRDSMSVGPDGTPQLQVPRTGAWPVDENGIPVRKTAPHPTEPVLPPQDVLKTGQRAPLPKPEAIVESALADGKDGKGSVWFAAGATLEALKRRSPLIQGVSRVVQHYKNIADSFIRESVFPFEDSLRKLSRTEVEQISKVLKAEMFNRQRFDMAKLAELGLSEKQLLAYSRIREMHGKALEAQNKAREAKGLKPITELDAYLSSRWQGDFRRVFKDKDGNVVWALADNTKRGLETQTASLLKEVPGLTHVDHTVKSARGWRPDYTQVYQTMIDVLGDDPAAAKAKSWYESQVMAAASETRAQEKHFKPKGNIRGFIGDRPGKAGFQESLDMLQQQINYAKNAHKWAAMQEAGLHLKDVLSSKELADAQPNNLRYAREYFADNIGANELAWVKAMEDGIRDLGISPNTIGSGVGTLKAIWVGQKLAANAGFLASNVIQSVNMLPTLAHMQVAYGGNPITSIPSGMLLGTAMAVSHVMGGKGTAVYKGLGQVPGLPTEFIARAMKFAEDNSVIAKSVYDESPIGSSFGIGGLINKVASKTISLPETFLRSIAYMTYVSQLKSSGKFKSDLDLFRVADEHVRASMGDYGEGERAMAFNKLGNIGNAANVLQTFPINYFNQWSWVSREAAKGNVAPFVTMFAVQASVAGAMGVPGFADADKVLEWIKDYVRDTSPKMWAKIKDFSLKEMVIKLGGESALYGLLSTQSGVALTSRAAAPAATEMAVVPGAPWADAVKQLGSVASAVTDPLNPQKRAQALFDIAPTGLQGYLETGPFKEFTSVTRPDGSTVYGKPSKMAAREGVYARTPEEETLRSFGFRSQKEAATKDALYRARKGEADVKAVVAKLPDKVWNELRLGRKDKAQELFQLHVELTGRGMSKQAITEQLKKEYMTQAEQMIARKNLPLEGLLAYKRFQDMMKEMGYEN